MKIIYPLGYFQDISSLSLFYVGKSIYIESQENYQKRSYRNKSVILTDQGPMTLSIPLKKGKHQSLHIQEVEISYDEDWVEQHIKSIGIAYSSAAYYAYYPVLFEILRNRYRYLYDLNLALHQEIMRILDLDWRRVILTTEYRESDAYDIDLRKDFNQKNQLYSTILPYPQVYDYKLGFNSNLCILDLLYNLGPETSLYLKRLSMTFKNNPRLI